MIDIRSNIATEITLDLSNLGLSYTLEKKGVLSNQWVNSPKLKLCAPNKLPIKVLFSPMHFGGQIYIEFALPQKMEAYRFPSLVLI